MSKVTESIYDGKRATIPELYRLARDGENTEVSRKARGEILHAMDAAGWDSVGDFLRYHGCDLRDQPPNPPTDPSPARSSTSDTPSYPDDQPVAATGNAPGRLYGVRVLG